MRQMLTQPGRGLVEEKETGPREHLGPDRQTTLLAPRYTPGEAAADARVADIFKAEVLQDLYSSYSFGRKPRYQKDEKKSEEKKRSSSVGQKQAKRDAQKKITHVANKKAKPKRKKHLQGKRSQTTTWIDRLGGEK